MELSQNRMLGDLAKRALPKLSRLATISRTTRNVARYIELGSCLLQGKGSGSGWDIKSEVIAACSCIHSKSPVLVDVGANFGQWSMLMLSALPGCSALLLIEPQPECLDSLARLNCPRRIVEVCAVAETGGETLLFTLQSQAGWVAASLFERQDSYFCALNTRCSPIRTVALDDLFEQHGLDTIDFMKMDIEGAELAALRGAQGALSRGAIRALSFEFGSGNINSRTYFRDFWRLLVPFGFAIHRILPGGRLHHIESYYEDLEYFRGVSNYIARLPP